MTDTEKPLKDGGHDGKSTDKDASKGTTAQTPLKTLLGGLVIIDTDTVAYLMYPKKIALGPIIAVSEMLLLIPMVVWIDSEIILHQIILLFLILLLLLLSLVSLWIYLITGAYRKSIDENNCEHSPDDSEYSFSGSESEYSSSD